METLEKVELIREKCNVSYEEARDALQACGGDVLDAIVMLEQANETTSRMPAAETIPEVVAAYELPDAADADSEPAAEAAPEPEAKTAASEETHKTSKVGNAWKHFCATCKELWNAGFAMTFIAERGGEQLFALPLTIVVLGLLVWGASLWLLIIGLFFGCRYRIEGSGKAVDGVNDAMGKAADAADSIKESIA